MVKRLHLGRAAESGILAARLASAGYTGPETVLEGKFGLLEAYCPESNAALLTADLGDDWETLRIKMKPYSSQGNTHTPIQCLRELMAEHGFHGQDVAAISVEASERVVKQHNIREPADIMQAQYSVPFTTALAAFHDLDDPRSFSDEAIRDPRARALATRIVLQSEAGLSKGWGGRMRVELANGERLEDELRSFLGSPETPFTADGLRRKFDRLIADEAAPLRASLFEELMQIDKCASVNDLTLA